MHRSGKYVPDAKWLIPTVGRGTVFARAEAAWKMYLSPHHVGTAIVEYGVSSLFLRAVLKTLFEKPRLH